MKNLLHLLIELANAPHPAARNALIEKQSLEIQQAFFNQDTHFIKQKLSNETHIYFNERAVVHFPY
jgi:hypothetical protein